MWGVKGWDPGADFKGGKGGWKGEPDIGGKGWKGPGAAWGGDRDPRDMPPPGGPAPWDAPPGFGPPKGGIKGKGWGWAPPPDAFGLKGGKGWKGDADPNDDVHPSRRGGGDRDRSDSPDRGAWGKKGGKKGFGFGFKGGKGRQDEDEDPNICRDFKRGICTRGAACRFSHAGNYPQRKQEDDELDAPPRPIIETSSDRIAFDERRRWEEMASKVAVVGSFAAPPQEVSAIDLQEEEDPLNNTVSEILGLSEMDIASMSAEELIIHIERRIRATRAKEEKYRRGADGEEMEVEDATQSVEIDMDDLPPLPPLPPLVRPVLMGRYRIQRVYKEVTVISELLAEKSPQAAEHLARLDDDLAVVIFRLLRETGLLRACKQLTPIDFPPIETPQLPRGYTSWIVQESAEEKARRMKKERELQEQKTGWLRFCKTRHKLIEKLRSDTRIHDGLREEARGTLIGITDTHLLRDFMAEPDLSGGMKLAQDMLK